MGRDESPTSKDGKADRAERLAAQLRANLARRKAQARLRRRDGDRAAADTEVPPPGTPGDQD